MKKAFLTCFLLSLVLGSCSRSGRPDFEALDRALARQSVYDAQHDRMQDSLRTVSLYAGTDSIKWEAVYALETFFFYHDIDSCYATVREMLRLAGADDRQRRISESCQANILYRMDSLGVALHVLQQIDTVGLPEEALNIYCFAGYHIYRSLSQAHPEYIAEKRQIIDKWWRSDSTRIDCAFYHNEIFRQDGIANDAISQLKACTLKTPNDTAKAYYFLAKESLLDDDPESAIRYFTASAECDIRLSAKAYNALYELALLLFRTGDIERADRYMRITLQDAYSSHYESRYEDVIQSELEVMNVLLEQQKQKKRAYFITSIAVALLLAVAIISLFQLSRYSSRLNLSRRKLSEVSKIKDNFLAVYMEKCVDYLNKVDEYRSSLRHTVKQDGPEAVVAMLRRPSFADGEFDGLLTYFDTAFLGIFPDFVEKVNAHMQAPYQLEKPAEGQLSTELRILALIRMGISRRMKIAKVLNMSVTTVYSYHSLLQKHSLHPDSGFDRVIANL